jgi:hypothetical protein
MAEGLARPGNDEYGEYYGGYIRQVPEVDLFEFLTQQPGMLRDLLKGVDEATAGARPAPAEWSIKEVIGHVIDTERVFAYRALRVSRGDETPLPGFDQNPYVEIADFNGRSLADLLDEFELLRRANLLQFKPLKPEAFTRRGTASGFPISARALLYMMAGHAQHHYASLRDVYLV